MPFTPTTPLANQGRNQSQQQFLDNFMEIDTFVGVNHKTFGNAGQGFHKFLQFVDNVNFSNVVPNANNTEIILGNQLSQITGNFELTIKRNNETYEIVTSLQPNNLVFQQIRLFSGILIRFGIATITNGGVNTLIFGTEQQHYVPFTTVYQLLVTPRYQTNIPASINTAIRVIDFTATQFRVYSSDRISVGAHNGSSSFSWLAIGI